METELEDLPGWGIKGDEITTLVVRPEVGYAEPNKPRTFSVYVPERLIEDRRLKRQIQLELVDVKGNVEIAEGVGVLEPHNTYSELLMTRFALIGRSFGDHGYVVARIDGLEDMAELKVQAPSGSRRQRLAGTNRGLFREIEFDPTPDPIQRVWFADGTIKVFLKFPPIPSYLRVGGQGMETPQGSLMLAELVAEGFCKEVARRRLDAGLAPYLQGGEIDAFNSQVNQLMRRHLGAIHQALVA